MYLDEAIYNIVVKEAKEVKSFVGRKIKCMEDNANYTLAMKGEVVEVVHQDGLVLTISKPINGIDGMKITSDMIGKEFKLLKKKGSMIGIKIRAKVEDPLSTGVGKGEVVKIVKEYKSSFVLSKNKKGYRNMEIEKPLNTNHWEIVEKTKKDTIVEAIVDKFKERSDVGIKKYNTTLDREDFTTEQWINHAIEESMDLILYLERLKRDITNIKKAVADGK